MAQSETSNSTNFFLDGSFAPAAKERDAQDMEVKGTIPKDLTGNFLRVGPNQVNIFDEAVYHTLDEDRKNKRPNQGSEMSRC